jgi:hypothetical protein
MLGLVTLLTRPLMVFFSASHVMRWYSGLLLFCISACICLSRKGGMYAPPALPTGSIFVRCSSEGFLFSLPPCSAPSPLRAPLRSRSPSRSSCRPRSRLPSRSSSRPRLLPPPSSSRRSLSPSPSLLLLLLLLLELLLLELLPSPRFRPIAPLPTPALESSGARSG